MKKWLSGAVLSLIFFLGASQSVYAESDWYIPDWVTELSEKINDMMKMYSNLMTGQFLKVAMDYYIVQNIDEVYAPLYDVFGKTYLFTPQLASIELVYDGWSLFSVVGLMLIIIAVLYLSMKVIHGKTEMKKLLVTFVVAMVLVYYSLNIMNFCNVGVNWVTQKVLADMLATTNINYQGLDGQQVLKALIIGSDAITNPSIASKSAGKLIADQPGGVFMLMVVTWCMIFPLYLISVFKVLLLIVLAVFVAFWITTAAFTGKTEIMVGFLNIYIRTLLVGFILALHWGAFVKAQASYGSGVGLSALTGIMPTLMAVGSGVFLQLFLVFFWLLPIYRSFKQPLTLNGGAVVEKAGDVGEKLSTVMNYMGKRFGSEELQSKSLRWKKKSKQMADLGRRMQEQSSDFFRDYALSQASGGVTEALQQVQYDVPELEVQPTGTMTQVMMKPTEFGFQQLATPEVRNMLSTQGFAAASSMSIASGQRGTVSAWVQQVQQAGSELGKQISWDAQTGKLHVTGGEESLRSVVKAMDEFQVAPEQVAAGMMKEGLFVNLKSKQVESVGQDEQTYQAGLKELKQSELLLTKMKFTPEEAAEGHRLLQLHREQHPWIEQAVFKSGALWIPQANYAEALRIFESLRQREVMRLDMPDGSRFLHDLMHVVRRDPDLSAAVTEDIQGNYVDVRSDAVGAFRKRYEEFTKARTPFWRTSSGAIKIILDGVPVDYGHVPPMGLDMGSFEALQRQTLRKQSAGKEAIT
ncbi:hypothetical protein [Paenibacillus sp. y28]|uniref:hypothetical protein n=1 Tax=Paenibacillus sp. y28 TaxID=3129110 RepID=UPI00301A5F30